MPPKRAKVTASSSSSSFDRTKFVSEEARKRFEGAKLSRNPIPERGVNLERSDSDVEIDIRNRGWEKFVTPPNAAVISVVREFYANAVESEDGETRVRGRMVGFDSATLNNLLGTREEDESQYHALVVNPDYPEILTTLCHPGAEWKPLGTFNCFDEKFLKVDAAVWYAFLTKRLMPVSHVSDVQKDRAVLLYALVQGFPINVGKVIFSQLMMSIHNKHLGLYFPTIISELCARAGVSFRDDEEWLQPLKPIARGFVTRKVGQRRVNFPSRSDDEEEDAGGPSAPVPRPLLPQPRRRSQNEKLDETLAFMTHQDHVNANFGEHFTYVESLMRTMLIQGGADPSSIPQPPPFIPPFQFQYAYQQPGDSSGVPPPELDEEES